MRPTALSDETLDDLDQDELKSSRNSTHYGRRPRQIEDDDGVESLFDDPDIESDEDAELFDE